MTSLVKAIQERLAKIVERKPDIFFCQPEMSGKRARAYLATAIHAADLSDLEPKERETPRTKVLKRKWSASEGASNSTCSPESHEIYALAEDLESEFAALTARLEAKEAKCEALRGEVETKQLLLARIGDLLIEHTRTSSVIDALSSDEINKIESAINAAKDSHE